MNSKRNHKTQMAKAEIAVLKFIQHILRRVISALPE